jgi:hypothetical protein
MKSCAIKRRVSVTIRAEVISLSVYLGVEINMLLTETPLAVNETAAASSNNDNCT